MQSLWMLCAAFLFSIMGVCVKLASSYYGTAEIVFWRGLIGTVAIFFLARLQKGSLSTTLPWQHAWRGAVGVVALWLWFFAFTQVPLATATTLNNIAPIWLAAIVFGLGWWRGQNRFAPALALAIGCSAIGVFCLLKPVFHAEQWRGIVAGLCSGLLSALAYLQVRRLGKLGEPEYRVVFYFSLASVLLGLAGSLWHKPPAALLQGHHWHGVALLAAIGICATCSQMAMTRAYRLGNALVTANLQYTGIVFSSIWGMLIWHDVPNWLSWLGMGIILSSGVIATFYNTRQSPAA
jgi:S-adenosylmethionine uptake transporter